MQNGITLKKARGILDYGENDVRRTWFDLKVPGFSAFIIVAKSRKEAAARAIVFLKKMGF